MSRILAFAAVLFILTGCRLPPDREPLKPLPEDGQVFSYDEMLSRARAQATAALEAFYIDNWADLAEAARGLEQTARFLPKTSEQPARLANTLVSEAVQLRKDALTLGQTAKNKNVNQALEILQRIHLNIRRLRSEPAAAKDAPLPKVNTK